MKKAAMHGPKRLRPPARIVATVVVLSISLGGLAGASVAASQQSNALTLSVPLHSGAIVLEPAERMSSSPAIDPNDPPPPVTPPTTGSAVDEFVRGVLALSDSHSHGDDTGKATEHMALLGIVPRSESTHIAVANGAWANPATWYRRMVPTAAARVLIPEGIAVNYDIASNTSLFTVRIDGALSFATNRSTRIVVDTLIVAPTGRLEIGTAQNPIGPNIDAEILIAANGDIDTSWDPTLVSRGVISHGAVEIHGAEKQSFGRVAQTPLAGHTQLVLEGTPDGWQIGDRIVLTGTKQLGWFWDNTLRSGLYHESQDEERTVTAINGSTITLDASLQFDHRAPRSDLGAYVANTSRSITVRSVGGDSLPVHQRGHAMFMHSDDVDVRYAAFDDLGRTDKSRPAADLSFFDSVTSTTNVKGRYSVHFHKTGTEHQEDPAVIIGNSVSRSPGWGFAHHSSHANFVDNVAFDVFGAAFAAEDGDETGVWLRNIAIKSEGIGWGDWTVKEAADVARHDNGRTGDGYFFAGRLVEAAENVAANTTNGFVWLHRGQRTNPTTANLQHPETGYGAVDVSTDTPAIEGFRENEAFATHAGIIVVKANPAQGHDVRSVFDGFLNWETVEGVNLSYTAHYTLKDLDLVGLTELEPFQNRRAALHVGTNAFDVVVNGIRMERFETGLEFAGNSNTFDSVGDRNHVVIDAEFIDIDIPFNEFAPGSVQQITSAALAATSLSFDLQSDTTLSLGEWFELVGPKTDSLGTLPRQVETDRHRLDPWRNIGALLASEGYWTLPDGTKVLLVADMIADRATGAVEKLIHVVEIDATAQQLRTSRSLNRLGGVLENGPIALGGPAPAAAADARTTSSFSDVVINVLANDSDPDGGAVSLSGITDPTHGDVVERADGTIVYRSDSGYVGMDSFDYWIVDEEGNLGRGTVTLTVTAPQAALPVSSGQV